MWGSSPLIRAQPAFLSLLPFTLLPVAVAGSLLFCSFLLCRLMFQINAGGVLRRTGAPQLVSALPGFAPPLRLPALKKIPSVCSPAWLAFTGWDNGPSWELPRKSLAQSCRDKMGRHPQFLFPNS